MIAIKRSGVKAPASLRGETETATVVAFFDDEQNRAGSFEFKAYKGADVLEALNDLFHGKCAYCESPYRATAPADIEHYRPKGAIVVGGKREKPGYYWLAARWDNLLPSCIDCNRARTQPFEEDDAEIREVSGKENKFPLVDEARRARRPEAESSEKGQQLLLHPCRDRPETHLEFLANGLIRPRANSRKGKASIEVYGLQRKWLAEARRAHVLDLAKQMRTIAFFVEALERNPDDDAAAAQMELEQRGLREAMDERAPYAGLSRQLIVPFETSLLDGTMRSFLADLFGQSSP